MGEHKVTITYINRVIDEDLSLHTYRPGREAELSSSSRSYINQLAVRVQWDVATGYDDDDGRRFAANVFSCFETCLTVL